MRNLLSEYGYSNEEIEAKINNCWHEMFEAEKTRIYFEDGSDTGYITDTGNNDVRTEGMSYGMMMAVQMDRQDVFDRLWLWAKRYMWQESGNNAGYFAWSCGLNGKKNSQGPAPDGEEYFALALFFASHRFGDRESPFNYNEQARAILHEVIHKGEDGNPGYPMWNKNNYYILFVPGSPFSDPSYHLPHFYELFGLWANEADREFWLKAAEESRNYLHLACHNETGLAPDYANFDGSPVEKTGRISHTHYSDSYRVALNIGLDSLWYGKDRQWQSEEAKKLQTFYYENGYAMDDTVVTVDGKPYPEPIMHKTAIIATAAAISAAREKNELSAHFINKFMSEPLRSDSRRYYDNCLYFFATLALSGKYRII